MALEGGKYRETLMALEENLKKAIVFVSLCFQDTGSAAGWEGNMEKLAENR